MKENVTYKIRFGFKGKSQVPLFMIWKEEIIDGEVVYAWVKFNSKWYIGL